MGPQLKCSIVRDCGIISYQPSEGSSASCSRASCCTEAEHNECGGRKPQQSRGRGCLGTRGPWPTAKHTHRSTLVAFKKVIYLMISFCSTVMIHVSSEQARNIFFRKGSKHESPPTTREKQQPSIIWRLFCTQLEMYSMARCVLWCALMQCSEELKHSMSGQAHGLQQTTEAVCVSVGV